MKPRVSVILPVRDGGRWLAEAVDSILGQTLQDLELLVVDDHSRDGAVAALCRADPRLTVFENPGHGVSAAFNAGFARASGEFIARMDADDLALPARLEIQLDYLDKHPDVAICGGCVELFTGEAGRPGRAGQGNRRYQAWLNACCSPEQLRREIFIESPVPNPTAVFRRSALAALGGYRDPDWPEDYDLYLRADAMGLRMGKPEPVVLRWREHDGRLTRRDPRYAVGRFQAAKAHFLVRSRLPDHAPVLLWGAGPTGRSFHDRLSEAGRTVEAFVDVHPRRIGGSKRGRPVWSPDRVGAPDGRFILVAVGAAGARRRIREFLDARGWLEGGQYLFVA